VASRARNLAIATRALAKAKLSPKRFEALWDDLSALARLVSAWGRREYNVVPWRSIAMASAALLYFINPFDAIPDVILGIGYLDDASVLAFVVGALKREIDRFAEWERRQTAARAKPEKKRARR
jgi:uncharacterized membrane protein YkvA (DUF1232 family)